MHLDRLLLDQAGIAGRGQLRACGVTPDAIKAQLRGNRWRSLNEIVVCTHNGPLTALQAEWAAILSAQGPVGICGLTAMARFGITGFASAAVHVLVIKSARVIRIPEIEIVVHESRRFTAADVLPRLPPTTGLERSTIDAAVWSPDLKTAMRVLVAPVQQRRTSAAGLREALSQAGSVKFRSVLLPFIADLEGGAEALSEVAFLRWCRRHGFPMPKLQVRYDNRGRRRYIDAFFIRSDGSPLLVEIDGGIHLTLAARWRDPQRTTTPSLAARRRCASRVSRSTATIQWPSANSRRRWEVVRVCGRHSAR